MNTKYLLIILSILLIFSCDDIPIDTNSTGTISGNILNRTTNTPISGVLVTTTPGSGTSLTTDEGFFTIENIEQGNYTVYAFKEAFELSKTNISIFENTTTEVSVLLDDDTIESGSITGTIYDSNGNTVSFVNMSTIPGTIAVVSNSSGCFSIIDIPVGEYSVIASNPNFVSSSISITVTEDKTTQADFVISKNIEVNNDPSIPQYTTPIDGTTNTPISLTLEWSCSDPDGDVLSYDIYFWEEGNSSNKILSDVSLSTYTIPTSLKHDATYFWMVTANDSVGGFRVSPIWSFTTLP